MDAAVAVGHKPTEDFNGDLMEGVGFNHATIKDGRRHSAWQAFAAPVLDSPRLTVTTGALVTRIVLDGGRAVAVEYLADGELRTARASAEIVLSAGAIGSPKILQLSGIGDRADLSAVGVETLVDLPGVGKNLHDHLLVGNLYATADALVPGRNNLLEAQLFAHSQQTDDAAPDLQPLFLHLPYPTDGGDAPADGYTIAPGLVAPRSRGTLRIASADPAAAPLVDPNILADDYDVEALVDAVILCREIGAQDAFAAFRPTEYVPSSEPADRDALRARPAARRHVSPPGRHVCDGRHGRLRRRPRPAGARRRRPPRRRRLDHARRAPRQHQRARDHGRREGYRPPARPVTPHRRPSRTEPLMTILAAIQPATGGRTITDPATGETVGRVAEPGVADIDAAVAAARAAQPDWAARGDAGRSALLSAAADAVETHAEELAVLLSREQGSR